MIVRFLGSGDAFGDGGRSQACILLDVGGYPRAARLRRDEPRRDEAPGRRPEHHRCRLLTHFHGDHAGGIPYLVLDGQFRKRDRPLTIAGPAGLREHVAAIFEAALPTSGATSQRFMVSYRELGEAPETIGPLEVVALPVAHLKATEPRGLRARASGHVVA